MSKKILAIMLALVMTISLAACGGAKDEAPADNAAATDVDGANETTETNGDEIRIGLYGTITGPNALAGEMLEKGGQLAVDKINAEGGINGRPLKLVVYDDKSSPDGALKAVTRLVDVDKVVAMVGSNSSPNILATTQITEDAKVIQLGSGTSPTYTNAGFEYLFRATANGDLPNQAMISAMHEMGVEKVALLSVASEYGKSSVESFKEMAGDDFEIVTEEIYQTTDTDYTGQIAKILNAEPDGVLIYGMTNESALAIKQFRRSGYDGFIYGPEALGVPDLLTVAGEDADNVIFGSGAVVPASVDEAANAVEKEMLEDFVAKYGDLPVSDVAYRGYDGVILIAEALKNAEDVDNTESIRDALVAIDNFEGIAGTYNFTDESGDGLQEARSYIIQDGKHVLFPDWRAENTDK